MADTKISAATDISVLVATDKLPVARVADATPYYATMAEIGAYTGTAAANAGALSGLGLVYNTTTVLSINAGTCSDSTASFTISLATLFTKSISGPWAAGSGNAGMGVGLTATALTWYHVFAVIVAGVPDVYFDSNVAAANKPVGTTAFRRIGSVWFTVASQIRQFIQTVDRFDWATPVGEFNGVPGVTTAVTQTLASVPSGLVVQALLGGFIQDTTTPVCYLYLSSLAQADVAASGSAMTAVSGATVTGSQGFNVSIATNASAQIRRRVASVTGTVALVAYGWIDTRGRG